MSSRLDSGIPKGKSLGPMLCLESNSVTNEMARLESQDDNYSVLANPSTVTHSQDHGHYEVPGKNFNYGDYSN